ncbi:MAG: hypothetical protein M3367_17555 [Acidobacteriota bacterium]|nr:hypothetical protein [Acidobacteriota bacterium]
MNKTSRTLITVAIVLTGALLASVVMVKFTPDASWLAFVGWTVFFVSLQAPFLFLESAQNTCMAWLVRFRKGE